MDYATFLTAVIDEGIMAARRDYLRPDQEEKLRGSIAGFEACRGLSPLELSDLLDASKTSSEDARRSRGDFWWYRCYELEVKWVCNVVSAMLHNEGKPMIVNPTARGSMTAANILGVRPH